MKKKLQLNKETVASLNEESLNSIKAGALANNGKAKNAIYFTGDCTNGVCGTFHSHWNCSKVNCSEGCPTPTNEICKFTNYPACKC